MHLMTPAPIEIWESHPLYINEHVSIPIGCLNMNIVEVLYNRTSLYLIPPGPGPNYKLREVCGLVSYGALG
jgi:hypothetical protein